MLLQRLQVPLRIISAGRFARHQCPLSNIKIWAIEQASKAEEDSLHLSPELLSLTIANCRISLHTCVKFSEDLRFEYDVVCVKLCACEWDGMFTFCRILVSTAWGSLPHSRSSI